MLPFSTCNHDDLVISGDLQPSLHVIDIYEDAAHRLAGGGYQKI
jgi:hypothetical protein